jgi:formate dehydrogenase major subunit
MIAEADGVCVLWAMGVTQHSMGSDTSTAISNLLLATGNYMRPGAGAYPLRGHNNVQGASDHGAMPNYFPGYQEVANPEIRAKFEKAWNVSLPPKPGLDNHMMIDAIHEGKLKAMYLFGEEMSLVDSNANFVSDALSKLDSFCCAGNLLQRDLPICGCDSASQSEPGERGNLHQYREAHSALVPGS